MSETSPRVWRSESYRHQFPKVSSLRRYLRGQAEPLRFGRNWIHSLYNRNDKAIEQRTMWLREILPEWLENGEISLTGIAPGERHRKNIAPRQAREMKINPDDNIIVLNGTKLPRLTLLYDD